MYPALPRWSDASAAAGSTRQRPAKPTLSPRTTQVHAEGGPSPDVLPPAPHTRPSLSTATPAPYTKKASRSGQLFVSHNTDLVGVVAPTSPAQTAGAVAPSSSSAVPSVLGPTSSGGYIGHRGGRSTGPVVYTTSRQGVVRGTTVANVVDTTRFNADPPLSLRVAGVQTGEGVLVESSGALAPRRRSFSSNMNNHNNSGGPSACQNPQDHVQVPQLKRQLEKANASVKLLTVAGRRQKQEHEAQKAEWDMQLAECEARFQAALSHSREREGFLFQHVTTVVKGYRATARKAKDLQQAAADEYNTNRVKWETEFATLRRDLEAAQASAAAYAANDSASAAHQREAEQLRVELEELRRSSAAKQLELETSLADAQSKLNKSTGELQTLLQLQQQCNYLAQQCRLFIRQVCRPGFSVVKGPSLEPVEKDRAEPTGFVLVPLTVLLHGYTLLPEGDRQEVIDHYDKEAKARR